MPLGALSPIHRGGEGPLAVPALGSLMAAAMALDVGPSAADAGEAEAQLLPPPPLRPARHSLRGEAAGCMGDLGTFVPLFVAMGKAGCIGPTATLIVTGAHSALSGRVFGRPLAVQPMKAIAAVALAHGLDRAAVAAAGALVAAVVGVLAATGLLKWGARACPTGIVRGVQAGLGLALAGKGLELVYHGCYTAPTVAEPNAWDVLQGVRWVGFDGVLVALLTAAATALLDGNGAIAHPSIPPALVVFPVGFLFAVVRWGATAAESGALAAVQTDALPAFLFPPASAWVKGLLDGAIPQLPLTVLNSVLAVCALSDELYGGTKMDERGETVPRIEESTVAYSIAAGNLAGFLFGSMPVCHGAGGLMAQHRFGARTGTAPVLLGCGKLSLGLLGLIVNAAVGSSTHGDVLAEVLQAFPKAILGVSLFVCGVAFAEHALRVAMTGADAFVSVATAAAALKYKSAVALVVGLLAHALGRAAARIHRLNEAEADLYEAEADL